jgi:peptidoglycan/xylan/chitin deacetylase (PgdA/CDA1 family)
MNRYIVLTLTMILTLVLAFALITGTTARIAIFAFLVAGYAAFLVSGSLLPGMNFYLRSVSRVPAAGRRVALTFDDGPHAKVSPALLDFLQAQHVPATFFYIGQAMAGRTDLVRRADAEGHLLGNHTFSHSPYWGFLRTAGLQHEIEQANHTFLEIIGKTPRFFRPPFSVTRPGLQAVLKRLRMVCVVWDVRGLEGPSQQDPEKISRRILDRIRDGSIVLLHEGYFQKQEFTPDQVIETVRRVVTGLRARGYALVRLDQLLGERGYQ